MPFRLALREAKRHLKLNPKGHGTPLECRGSHDAYKISIASP